KLDHYQIDLVKEIGKTPEWNIEAIEISATTKNGVNILYSSPIVYDGYVHSYKSAKFSLKSDLVVVLDVTTASIDNAGTEDDVYFNFKFPEIDGTGKKINVSSWKNYLVEGKKKKIVVTYSDFPKNLTVAPKFQFFNAGGDGWAVEEFKVYIFNPADNSGVISDFCWGDNCSAAASDKQLWSYHFEGYSAPLGNNGQIAPNGCFNADGVLWLDTDTQGCSSTSWIQAEQGMPYLGFDDVK
ncbi:MAG: hypothetical protein HYU98_00240, partial [Deltaproteobacteria bacterium]|nr:hypothetical protein [Deltaproteobacteria bacterium]